MESRSRQRDLRANGNQRRPPRLPKPPGPRRTTNGNGRPKLRKLRLAFVLLGLSLLAFVSWIFGIMMAVAQDLPSLENRSQYQRAENSVVTDIDGERLATLTNNQGRILVSSAEIAPSVKEAVVAIEDRRFYDHRGVDFQGIARAVYQDVLSGSASQGASTITQQFVKNALAAQESRTIFQKLREAALAYHLERQWSKDKVMTEYLNSIYFGEGAYGIEAAARTFFGTKPEYRGCGEGEGAPTCASQLLPWDAALLAGIISSPAAYSPIANPNDATARRNLVLELMVEQGSITETEFADYSQQPIPSEDEIARPEENSEAPYFTSWLRQQVVDHYGAGEAFGGGLTITSTLDLDLQREVEGIVASRLAAIEPTASVVVLDNQTAGVRAMVGGSDYSRAPFNLATQGRRQPGSAFKPFTLVTALSEGHSSGEVFTSAPQRIPFEHPVRQKNGKIAVVSEIFEVRNYEDQYLGSASIATATTFSDNSVYAQIGNAVGWDDVAGTAERMGIQTRVPSNPAMVLGGLKHGVTPLEMAHAYNTLAQDGYRISGTLAASESGPLAIQKVTEDENDDGVVDEGEETVETTDGESGENKTQSEQVIDPGVASEAKTLLTSVVTAGTGENAATTEAAWGKTGTTDDNGDAWFCGATDEITVCVWVGHADSVTPMETEFAGAPVDGGTYPALIFSDVVIAWESLQESGEVGDGPDGADDDEEDATSDDTEATAPEATAPEPTEAPADTGSAPSTDGGEGGGAPESPAPAGGGGSGGGGAVPSGGGISAG